MSPVQIFMNIILPIFILIGIGAVADRAFNFDIQTLSRFIFNILTPAVIFLSILRSDLLLSEILSTAAYGLLHAAVMGILGFAIFSLRFFKDRRKIFTLGSAFYNAGNYGFPLMLLAFGERALSTMAIIVQIQVIVLFTAGLLFFLGDEGGLKKSVVRMLKMPVMYVIPLGFALRTMDVSLPDTIIIPLDYINGGFVSMSLITLGAQLGRSKIMGDFRQIAGIGVVRLLLSPIVTMGLVLLLNITGDIAKTLILGAGLPVAVNVFVVSAEFNKNPNFASRMVFWTTLASAITIPLLMMIIQ